MKKPLTPMVRKISAGTHLCTYFTTGLVDLGKPELLMPIAHESLGFLFRTAMRCWASPENHSHIVITDCNMAFSIVAFDSADLEREAKQEFMGTTIGTRHFDVRLVVPEHFGVAGPWAALSITVDKVRLCALCLKHSFGAQSCGCCRSEWYCSKECQRADWKKHKTRCAATTAEITCSCCSLVHSIPTGKEKKKWHREMRARAAWFKGLKPVLLVTDEGTFFDSCCRMGHVVPWLTPVPVD